MVIFSPVQDHNKPFSKEEYEKFKLASNRAVILLSIIVFVLVVFLKMKTWGFSIAAGMCVASLSLIAGTIKNKVHKERRGVNGKV